MSRAADCSPCMVGNHEGHDREWGIVAGVIGGTYCACSGDCRERFEAAARALSEYWTWPPAGASEAGGGQ